ncbi:hypothetical protein DENSPDRAFT_663989 [Dentipellis sp. KUC8613]|nr:hypothetical protein DENSPDRAFT_663989 [Dentipellis sp. KUC8613]
MPVVCTGPRPCTTLPLFRAGPCTCTTPAALGANAPTSTVFPWPASISRAVSNGFIRPMLSAYTIYVSAVPHAGTIAMAPSSGPRQTRSRMTAQQGAQRVPGQKKQPKQKAKRAEGPKPIPHDEAGIYPVSTRECVGTGKEWACPFPGCEVAGHQYFGRVLKP